MVLKKHFRFTENISNLFIFSHYLFLLFLDLFQMACFLKTQQDVQNVMANTVAAKRLRQRIPAPKKL
jgi:hypothetical protein